jgi:hypothetical protein
MKGKEVMAFSDVSSDEGGEKDFEVPYLTLFEHKLLDLVGDLQACGVSAEKILITLEALRYAPRIIEAATSVSEDFVDVKSDVRLDDRTGMPLVGVMKSGQRILQVETIGGDVIRQPVAKYLTVAYKVLAYMLGHYSFVQVVKTHWQIFSKPELLMGAIRRTENARKRRLITTILASDVGGFGLKLSDYPAVELFDHEAMKKLILHQDIEYSDFTPAEIRRVTGLLAHIYHFIPVIMSEERPGISERVTSTPMPDLPEVSAVNNIHQDYARYFYENYFIHGICDPCMFFTVVLRDYILDKKVSVVRAFLRDMSPLYKMYKRVLTMAIHVGSNELQEVAVNYQGIKLAQIPGVQGMKSALTTEIYSQIF